MSASSSVLKGNTGEYFVLAELSRRGWVAAQTARNTRAFDILARKGDRQVGIRVKTKTEDARVFQWNAKENGGVFLDIGQDDFCVLVEIPALTASSNAPTYYVVPTAVVHGWLESDFEHWVSTPGARGQQRDAKNKRRLFHLDGDTSKSARGYRGTKLAPYLNNWAILDGLNHETPLPMSKGRPDDCLA
jgi:hypothetical protein